VRRAELHGQLAWRTGPRRGKGREGTSPAQCRRRRRLGQAQPGRTWRGHGGRSALVAGGDGDGFANVDDHCSGREDLDLASCGSPSGVVVATST
jgi:hypothetical protein